MAGGTNGPVLTIDINDDALSALKAFTDAVNGMNFVAPNGRSFQENAEFSERQKEARERKTNGTSNAPPAPPAYGGGGGGNGGGRGDGRGGGAAGDREGGESRGVFRKFFDNLETNGKRTLRTYREINRTLASTTERITGLFTSTFKWGSMLTAAATLGPIGFGAYAAQHSNRITTAEALGVQKGDVAAIRSVYSPFYQGVESSFNAFAAGHYDRASPVYGGMIGYGLNPNDGPAANFPKLLEAVDRQLQQYGGDAATVNAILEASGLGQVVTPAIVNSLARNPGAIREQNREYEERRQRGNSVSSGNNWRKATSRLDDNMNRVSESFELFLGRVSPGLISLSDAITSVVTKLLTATGTGSLADKINSGLQNLADYLGSPEFESDLQELAVYFGLLKDAAKGLWEVFETLVSFAAEHPTAAAAVTAGAVLGGPIAAAVGAGYVAAKTAGGAARVAGKVVGAGAGAMAAPGAIGAISRVAGGAAGLLIPTNQTPTTEGEFAAAGVRPWWSGMTAEQAATEQAARDRYAAETGKQLPPVSQSAATPAATGGDLATRNNNPLNLRYHPGQVSAIKGDGGFARFSSPVEGLAQAARQMRKHWRNGDDTVGKLVNRWAPPSENDTGAYAEFVAREMGVGINDRVDLSDDNTLIAMQKAMAQFESRDNAKLLKDDDYRRGAESAKKAPVVYMDNATNVNVRVASGSDLKAQVQSQAGV